MLISVPDRDPVTVSVAASDAGAAVLLSLSDVHGVDVADTAALQFKGFVLLFELTVALTCTCNESDAMNLSLMKL